MEHFDVVVIGGGHNGLVAAAYLARAGRSVLVLERLDHLGGAAVSERAFAGVDARLSRYSYLVSLLPDRIIADLGLDVRLASRKVASYTPDVRDGTPTGLLVEREPGPATAESFRRLTGDDREWKAWQGFYADLSDLARRLAPTMLEPLRPAADVRELVGTNAWERFLQRPLGEVVEETFADDLVRGVVLTDALIGTFTHAHDQSLLQNRCFLYHLIGNGTGEWKVPVGGMGAVTAALESAARIAGADLRTGADVIRVDASDEGAEVAAVVAGEERVFAASYVLSNVAPATLDRLRGRPAAEAPEGAQLKLNLLLTRLPRLRSGAEARQAFAGTLHVAEGYADLQRAYDDAAAGRLPSVQPPSELYCHTLTDPSILSPDLTRRGWHTVTVFALHTPARLFRQDNASARDQAALNCLAALNDHLAEPIEDCLATDADGRPCIEVRSPLDVEADVGMPGGHIFHGDLAWPWAETPEESGTWGVETDVSRLLICGAGARRAGGVSGIGGHNAAKAILDVSD